MASPSPKTCAACGHPLAPDALYYRFTLVLQGEQDVLGTPGGGTGDELAEVLRQLEAGPDDPQEWEDQIHWERNGVICSGCRSVVMRTLGSAPGDPSPH